MAPVSFNFSLSSRSPSAAPASKADVIVPTNESPYYGYNLIDPEAPTYSVEVNGHVAGPVKEVFDLARHWSNDSPYWNKQFSEFISYTPTSHPDGVGSVREFITNGRQYSEILLHVDHAESRFVYGLLSANPPIVRGVVTYADFDPVPGHPNLTKVSWSNVLQPTYDIPSVVNLIKQGQTAAYNTVINTLKPFFTPELGFVNMSITSGSVKRGRPDYLTIRMSSGPVTYIETSKNGSPETVNEINFPILSYDDQILITLFDRKFILEDPEVGTGFLPVQDVPEKKGTVIVPVTDTSGEKIGSYTLCIKAKWSQKEPVSEAESFGNAAFLILNDLQGKIMEIAVNLMKSPPGTVAVWEYGTYAGNLGPLPKYCKLLPGDAALMPKRLGYIMQRLMEYVYSQAPVVGLAGILPSLLQNPEGADIPVDGNVREKLGRLLKDPFLVPFTDMWMPEPTKVISNLKDDEKSDMEIAQQLIRGVNPMKITVASKPSDLPEDLQSLTDTYGRSVEELIAEKSLFFCDYWEVAVGDYDPELGVYKNQAKGIGGVGTMGPMKYWYAPHLAVFKRKDGKLDILGFTLTRFTDKPNVVYSKKTTPPVQYKLAKLHLTCADNQHHQFISHLGIAHLCMEPFAVANNNAFPPVDDRHPIGELLDPHFQDTIGINFLARQTLVSEVAPFTDETFSPGTENAMKIFSRAYEKWDFFKSNFVNDLASRGFDEQHTDGLDGFYYREDGFKVWNLFKEHFGRVVSKLYKNDAEVAADKVLQGWCTEVRSPDKGNIASFPAKIDSIELLVETITTLVFYCSAQHAAVNFSQLRYVAYVPNRPDSLMTAMVQPEKSKGDIGADALFAALPGIEKTEFQTLFAYLLSTPPDNPFDVYNALQEKLPFEVEIFKKELEILHLLISNRNKKLTEAGEIPYEYLDPMNIPQSINI